MSDLVAIVLQYVTDHPHTTKARCQEDIRKPVQEIDHAFAYLNRTGKIYQPLPGEWLVKGARPAAPEVEPPMPKSRPFKARVKEKPPAAHNPLRRCPRCPPGALPKPRSEFTSSGFCKPCTRSYQRDYRKGEKRHQAKAPATPKTIEDVRLRLIETRPCLISPKPVLTALKRLRASIDEEIAKLEAA